MDGGKNTEVGTGKAKFSKGRGKRRKERLAWKMEEVKVERRFEFGCGKQKKWKGEKHASPRGRKVRNIAVVSKKNVVAAGKEGKVTKYRT